MVIHRNVEIGLLRYKNDAGLSPNFATASSKMIGMFIHTFAFRWKPGVTTEQIQRAAAGIRDLQGKIPGLVETWVGENISPRSLGYQFGGVMKFADRASLEAYGGHPVHQALLEWLMPLIEPMEVDFEC
jgi:hypothetical protein